MAAVVGRQRVKGAAVPLDVMTNTAILSRGTGDAAPPGSAFPIATRGVSQEGGL